MMENHRGGIVTSAEADRLSNLPEHLIDLILERLPLEDVVRTSLLSKKWRYRWTKFRELVFDERFSNKFAKNGDCDHNGFISTVNKILILHKGFILKFHLHIPNINLDSIQEVEQILLLLSRNGVRELILTNSNRDYELSSHVFSCLELRKLTLRNCLFNPPLEFKGFPNLEELSLSNTDFGANMSGTEINVPQLKRLNMYGCTHIYNFNIKATKLKSLTSFSCPDAMLLQLLDSPCLTNAVIAFPKPKEDFVRVEKMNLARLNSLSINNDVLKVLFSEKIAKLLPRAINSLQDLILQNFQVRDFDCALCLLQSSPNLEMLFISMNVESPVDVGPALNQLESSSCLNCRLNQLKTIHITDLDGSRPQLLFIKLLLAHSPSLKKLVITPSGTCDVQKRLDISEDVVRFPRASPKAEVVFLNFEPMFNNIAS